MYEHGNFEPMIRSIYTIIFSVILMVLFTYAYGLTHTKYMMAMPLMFWWWHSCAFHTWSWSGRNIFCYLTHWGRDKMTVILQTPFSNTFFEWKYMNFVISIGPISNIPALVQKMDWRRPCDKPLSQPMMVKFTDAYIRHSASISLIIRQVYSTYTVIATVHNINWSYMYPSSSKDIGTRFEHGFVSQLPIS